MEFCLARDGWVASFLSGIQSHVLLQLYNKGPIGAPQPFRTAHGEWGPPIGRTSDIDWEPYSVALICGDALIAVMWHWMAATLVKDLRIKWLSPTFRVSLAYMFGTMRLCMVIYFFRSRPDAVYTYLHTLSFVLHSTMGMVVLIFGDGPWSHLRPNQIGAFGRDHHFNPYKAIPNMIRSVSSRIEYLYWGALQWLLKVFPRGSKVAAFLWRHVVPATTMMETGIGRFAQLTRKQINKLHFTGKPERAQETSMAEGPKKMKGSDTASSRSLAIPEGSTRPHILCDPVEVNGEVVELESPASPTQGGSDPPAGTQLSATRAIPVSPPFTATSGRVQGGIPENWSLAQSDTVDLEPGEVVLLGPSRFKMHVAQNKWNESIVFWAKPSLEKYFGQKVKRLNPQLDSTQARYPGTTIQLSPKNMSTSPRDKSSGSPVSVTRSRSASSDRLLLSSREQEKSDRQRPITKRRNSSSSIIRASKARKKAYVPPQRPNLSKSESSSWGALDAFISTTDLSDSEDENFSDDNMETFVQKKLYGVPVRGTVTLRGDGVLLSISTAAPSVRAVEAAAKTYHAKPEESSEVLVELIGRRMNFASGRRIVYTYAEFRGFGMRLNERPKATLLWLLNQLNEGVEVENLRSLRQKNFIEFGTL